MTESVSDHARSEVEKRGGKGMWEMRDRPAKRREGVEERLEVGESKMTGVECGQELKSKEVQVSVGV